MAAAAAAEEDINLQKGDFEELVKHRPTQLELHALLERPDFFRLPLGANNKLQSKRIDRILGFKIPKIEQKLLKKYKAYYDQDDSGRKRRFEGSQTWIGLHPQVLQTPYSEILAYFQILKEINPRKIVDIGAGYGRVGIVTSSFFPQADFVGYEIIEERLNEAQRIFERLGLENCQMELSDLSKESFVPPAADIYFIYDFSDVQDIRKILTQIGKVNRGKEVYVIAKGEFIQPIIGRMPEYVSLMPPAKERFWDIFKNNS